MQEDGRMRNVLVLTTDLPYFPGKNGHDFFNLRYLATSYKVGVVAPKYENVPKEGLANLESFLDAAFLWPRRAPEVHGMLAELPPAKLKPWVERWPARLKYWVYRKLLNLEKQPSDAFEKIAILSNCAPQLLDAVTRRHWDCVALIQTNLEPWMCYLPSAPAKLAYFHDVRSDYLSRLSGGSASNGPELVRITLQERKVCKKADAVGFVSDLDMKRAEQKFGSLPEAGVAKIPVDTAYYKPSPEGFERDRRKIVLFTGHLAHPPNVDAVCHFLDDVWPIVLSRVPDAVFQVVGMHPGEDIRERVLNTSNCEIHANVPDVRPYFWSATAYVIPMRYGGGVRQKIFEAWSMCVPVIGTPMAMEGVQAVPGEHFLQGESAENFANEIVAVLEGRDVADIKGNAKALVESHYSIAAAAPAFKNLVDRAVSVKRARPFKLLYDLRWMEIGKAGGIEQATYELISAVSNIDRRNGYRIFSPRSTASEWDFPPQFNVSMHASDASEMEVEALRSLLANGLGGTIGQPPIMNTAMRNLRNYSNLDFDLVHSVAGYTHPDLIHFPNVLTINDLQHLHYPEFFTPDEFAEREKLYRSSADAAKHIICISEYTRQDIHAQYGIPLDRMSTVWIIPSKNVWSPLSKQRAQSLVQSMGVKDPFLLFPAHCWPHKNHARLVEAFAKVLSKTGSRTKLVLTGRPFPYDHPAAERIRDLGLTNDVMHLGFRSPLEVKALFQECHALVFPSLFEGYGMPVAEAIICGKPVLCSNDTSLPEIGGDAALMFDPKNVDEMADKMSEIIVHQKVRSALEASALKRRAIFNSRLRAIDTLSIYERVYREHSGS